ncbi:MAG: His-Xaa-Ser system radical SAM maturase HxsB [Bacteroidales bacterium]|nr:His-Xaa-Ser system radical SAM maturase HxsB [Bacteroidales bacterium]
MYYLLPFHFRVLQDKEVLTNDLGDYLIVPRGSVDRIVNRKISEEEDLFKDLLGGFFVGTQPIPRLIENMATRLATRKSFLDDFTSLHIFVLTLRCNQNCIYCQASSHDRRDSGYDMSEDDLRAAVDLMFQSPSKHLTMEFQGGEPTLVSKLIRSGILYAEKKNLTEKRSITYVICSNCVYVSDDFLSFCSKFNVVFSTSLDGPEFLHNHNRGKVSSYKRVTSGIQKVRNVLGNDKISALMTTSEESLKYPKEIVDAYLENGFRSIFLRALNPYGLARTNENWLAYYDSFVHFYKESLDYILELNKNGVFFVEEFTTLILKKIVTPFPIGFVDLQTPSGIINGVIVYNYDGKVYASDESRMLAEYKDYTFCLGRVTDKYEDLFYGERAQKLSRIWSTECIAGCSECAYQSICGADPVRNYTTQGDSYGFRPSSTICRKNRLIIDHIFSLLSSRAEEVLPIFLNWITGTRA